MSGKGRLPKGGEKSKKQDDGEKGDEKKAPAKPKSSVKGESKSESKDKPLGRLGATEDLTRRLGSLGSGELGGGRRLGSLGGESAAPRQIGTIGSLGQAEGPTTPGRLASVNTGPKTLGGVAKRTFAPRIPVKIKSESRPSTPQESSTPKEAETQQTKPKFEKRDRKPVLIENYGLFSQGPMGASSGGNAGGIAIMSEEMDLRIGGGSQVRDDEETEDYSQVAGDGVGMEPTALPMSNYRAKKNREQAESETVRVKAEIGADEEQNEVEVTVESKTMGQDAKGDVDTVAFFKRAASANYAMNELWKGPLMFFQLPPAIPVSFPAPDPTKPEFPKASAMGGGDGEDFKDRLGPLEDGYMGKLRFHRSGRVTLKLGEVVMEVKPGTQVAFSQSVTAISPEHGQLMMMGDINQRFVCSPVVEDLVGSGTVG